MSDRRWTIEDLKAYTQRRLASEQRAREKMQAKASRQSAVCPKCRRTVQIGIPEGGDGSADVFYRHSLKTGGLCEGSRQIVKV